MEILPTFQSTPTYVSARLSMKIKNYNLLSSVTVSGVIDWIWIINEVTEVDDGSVTANFAVTLPCFQWLLMGCWLGYTELFSFSRLKLLFLMLGTKVSSAWNFSSKAVKPKFRTLENSGSSRWNEWNKAGNWSLTYMIQLTWCVLVLVDNFVCYNWISLLNIL